MPVPSFDQFISPLLMWLAAQAGAVRTREAHEAVADALQLSAEERAERVPSGVQLLYANRNGWAHDRLKRAGLSQSSRRGVWQITQQGKALAMQHPGGLPDALIAKLAYGYRSEQSDGERSAEEPYAHPSTATPEDRIDASLREIRDSVGAELLELISGETPAFFEQLVLDLLHAMGYGLSRQALQGLSRSPTRAIGGPRDGGIDGVISLDRLGLQKVYVQAKRWQQPVGGPVVRDFIGALTTHGADMGVLLTTSKFTADAHATADKVRSGTIVLVDGKHLTELMIEHGVGVSYRALRLPKIDMDYFEG